MPRLSSKNKRNIKHFAAVGAIGWGAGLLGEFVNHGEFGHRDKRTHPIVRNIGNLCFWAIGASPPPFGGWHRHHHINGGEPRSYPRAVLATIREVFVSEERGLAAAQEAYDQIPVAVHFDMRKDRDPALTYDNDGRPDGFKYEGVNKLAKVPHKIGHIVVPAAIIGLFSAYHKLTEDIGTGKAIAKGIADYAALFTSASIPNACAPLLEWSKGGEAATDMGVDVGIPILHLVAPANVLEHNAHHNNPGTLYPAGTPPYSFDGLLAGGLEAVGLAVTDPAEC
jgi:hypothetical protein